MDIFEVDNNDTSELALTWNMASGSGLLSLAENPDVTDAQLLAQIRGSSFYRTKAKPLRDHILLMRNDPATYKAQLDKAERELAQLFIDAGAKATKKKIKKLARRAFMFDLTPEQLRTAIANSIDFEQSYVRGIAGELMQNVRNTAQSFGFRLEDGSPELVNYVRDIITKQRTENDIKLMYANEAKKLYPAFSARFDAGATLSDVAEPYLDLMSEMWEMPKGAIDFSNTTLREMLQTFNPKDGAPTAMSLTDARRKLMQSPMFMNTLKAQNMFTDALSNIGRQWGLG
jgi:hypothetical protein